MMRKKKARFKSIFEFITVSQDDIYKDEERMTAMQNLVDGLRQVHHERLEKTRRRIHCVQRGIKAQTERYGQH